MASALSLTSRSPVSKSNLAIAPRGGILGDFQVGPGWLPQTCTRGPLSLHGRGREAGRLEHYTLWSWHLLLPPLARTSGEENDGCRDVGVGPIVTAVQVTLKKKG